MAPPKPLPTRTCRNALLSIVPPWLSNRPGFNVGFRILWAIATQFDTLVEQAVEGVRAAFPGLGTPTALPILGLARGGFIQGEAESDAAFEARLIPWQTTMQNAGGDEVLLAQIQSYLANTPRVSIVTRAGNWTTIETDGSYTLETAAWDWDSVTNPERAGWWSDLWIIVYPTEYAITGTTLASLNGIWGKSGPGIPGLGHAVPPDSVANILQLVSTFKGAHVYVQAIIWSYASTLFTPGDASSTTGTNGTWARVVGGQLVPARPGASDGTARYWEPSLG